MEEMSITADSRQPAAASPPDCADSADERFRAAVEQAKLDAMKELAYGASHEINNPLANIAARAQTLLKREHDVDKRRMLEAIHRQAMRAHEMIADLMLFARPPALERQPFDLVEMVNGVLGESAELLQAASVSVSLDAPSEPIQLLGDRTQLAVAVTALINNSVEAMGSGGEIAITVDGPSAGVVSIAVRDTGPGIPSELREHLFDPFFSGREAGRGLGFGLSKCWRIVTDHGGTIRVDSPPASGAVFKITLPHGSD